MISKQAVVQICTLIERHLKEISDNKVLAFVSELRKVDGNQSYNKTMEAIEAELRWRFGKDF